MDSVFAGLLTAVVGVLLCFGGLRFFRFLMLVVGFVGGFVLGALGVSVVTKTAFLAGVTGWVVAILAGVVLAGFAYAIYVAGVAVLGGVLGYVVGFSVITALGYGTTDFLTQGVAIAAAGAAVLLTFLLNVHRWLVIFYTALAGGAIIVAGTLILLGHVPFDTHRALEPVDYVRGSPIWVLAWAVLALAGLGAQWRTAPRPVKPAPVTAAQTPATASVHPDQHPQGPGPQTSPGSGLAPAALNEPPGGHAPAPHGSPAPAGPPPPHDEGLPPPPPAPPDRPPAPEPMPPAPPPPSGHPPAPPAERPPA